jgi:hypothetical protein
MTHSHSHSPAPWTAFQDPIRRWTIGNVTHRICDMWGKDPAFYTAEDAANARLIAASPNLLLALKALMGAEGGESGQSPDQVKAWEQAEAAIDKATKESI